MLTKNLWQKVGLVIGIRGEVVGAVYAVGKPAPAPPLHVAVRRDAYAGPRRFSLENKVVVSRLF